MKKDKALLLGLFVATFFSGIEHTIIATAMPSIIEDLNGVEMFIWATTIYTLSSIAILPIVGKLSDTYDRKWLYLIGMSLFLVGSALCGIADSMVELIIFRSIQGFGTGIISPLTQIIIGYTYEPIKRAKIQAFFSMIYGGTTIIGPLVGGLLTDLLSWRWVFYINIPFGVMACILIYIGLQSKMKMEIARNKPDLFGSILIPINILILMFWISFVEDIFEWNSFLSYSLLTLYAITLFLFVHIQKRVVNPTVDLTLFKNKFFTTTVFLSFISGMMKFGAISFVPLYMHIVMGTTTREAGSVLTPLLIGMIFTNYLSAKGIIKYKYRNIVFSGMLFTTTGYYLLSQLSDASYIFSIYISMLLLGFGIGSIGQPLTIVAQTIIDNEKIGVITSTITFFRWSGGMVGLTLISFLMKYSFMTEIEEKIPLHSSSMSDLMEVYYKNAVENDTFYAVIEMSWNNAFQYTFFILFILSLISAFSTYFLGNGKLIK